MVLVVVLVVLAVLLVLLVLNQYTLKFSSNYSSKVSEGLFLYGFLFNS